MEIKNLGTNAISSYKKIASAAPAKKTSVKSNTNTDKVDFDFSASFAAAKANIASRADAQANAAEIEALQGAYAGETCPVSSETIAKAILGVQES